MDARTSGVGAWLGFTSGSTALMASILVAAGVVAWVHDRRAAPADVVAEVEIAEEPPPPPPSVVEPEPAKAQEAPSRPSPATPPVTPAARAGQVLTAQPKPDDPVDLTNAFVQGIGDHYTGSFTTATGTGTAPPVAPPVAAPQPVAPRMAAVAPPVQTDDRSRPPSLSGATEWSCPFPEEADSSQIDDAYVTLQVSVGPEGAATAAQVVSDPGHGFGREARRCAMARRYVNGLDRDGNPIPGTTRPFRVHFSR